MRRLGGTFVVFALLAAGCNGDDGTTGDREGAGGAVTSTTGPREQPATTTATPPAWTRCESPEGFAVEYPASWHTNGECSQFHPEPFEPPGATDERVAAITAYVDPVPFEEVALGDTAGEPERRATTVDGLPAVRLAYETGAEGFWPEGTPVTLYAVDLSAGGDTPAGGQPRTLFLDTVGLTTFDYGRNQGVLDEMAGTLEVSAGAERG